MKRNYHRSVLSESSLKGNPKADELCLTEFICTRLIRLQHTLRVYGNGCCFSSPQEQNEKGKSVLQTLYQESDNRPLLSLTPYSLTVIATTSISRRPRRENSQHSFSPSIPTLLAPPTTLIRSKQHPRFKAKFSSIFFIPEGRFSALKNRLRSTQAQSDSPGSCSSENLTIPNSSIRRTQ